MPRETDEIEKRDRVIALLLATLDRPEDEDSHRCFLWAMRCYGDARVLEADANIAAGTFAAWVEGE